MNKLFNTIACLLLVFSFTAKAQIWQADINHSSIQFKVTHLVISSVTGDFAKFEAKLTQSNKSDFANAKIDAVIEVSSVDTKNLTRDKHLKEDDFFNIDKYPKMTFISTGFEKIDDKNYKLTGELTIRDVTKTVVLNAVYGGKIKVNGKERAGFSATGKINRFDYDLKWSDTIDSGSLVVGETVEIILNMELVKQ
jgi:polyisoprenoid-binding protein YceI